MTFRKIDTEIWVDPWFEALSPKAKLAFIYLWTNDICSQAGIYEISENRIKFELGYHIDMVYSELQTRIVWYRDRNLIWVKNFFKRQCQNSKFAVAALNSINNDSFKLQIFIGHNRKLLERLKINLSGYHIDTISIPYPIEAEAETDRGTDRGTSCSEPCPASEPQATSTIPIVEIPLIKKDGLYQVTQNQADEWQCDYPGIDVMQELRNIKQWNKSNPSKRKTRGGILKHITGWLAKEQNKGGGIRSTTGREDYI